MSWDLDEIHVASYYVGVEEANSTGLAFSDDGTRMYVIGTVDDAVGQYDLSVPWTINTAVYNDDRYFPSAGQNHGIAWKPDGTQFWTVSTAVDRITTHICSTPWDVTTATEDDWFSLAGEDTFMLGLSWNPDGSSFFTCGNGNDKVYRYDCATPWDVTTATFVDDFSVAGQTTSPQDLFFRPDGERMFLIGNSNVYRYGLVTPWDLSTMSFVGSVSTAALETSLGGFFYRSNGGAFYVVGSESDTVFQYGETYIVPGHISVGGYVLL